MKSKTHIYMANMILKELKDTGRIALKGYSSFSVPPIIAEAILTEPQAFRAGAVGPDFYPDMIAGQTVIHPSDSGKWLDRMEAELLTMSPLDKEWNAACAFYMGFHLHYAGDMFGHDYVNKWAGGSFPDISEAIYDLEKAKNIMRHILVETYMDEKVPADEDMRLSAPMDFVYRCFATEDAMELYPDSDVNLLKWMVELKQKIHQKSQDNEIRMLDIANYFPSWEADIESAIRAWLESWNRIAQDFVEEDGLKNAGKELKAWFKEWGPKLTFVPKWIVSFLKLIGDIIEFLDVFAIIETALKNMLKGLLMELVYAVTGIREEDIDKLIQDIQDFFTNPKLYLNKGFLFEQTNITDQLDGEFGNYGKSSDVHNQTFQAYDRCLNMCRLAVIGEANLNSWVKPYYSGMPLFHQKNFCPGISRMAITIATGTDAFGGTDDNVFFAVVLNDGRVFEEILDRPGYNDFERGDVDTYVFELPETVRYKDIKELRIRKDYINIDDDWKMQHVKVVDVADQFCLVDKETNTWIKKREKYFLPVQRKTSQQKLPVDAAVMNHLYSLDGACPPGKPAYKPWNDPAFFLNANMELRTRLMLPVFQLPDAKPVPDICYQAHVKDLGWLAKVMEGETAGTTGQARRMEAVCIWLLGAGNARVAYSVHVQNKGWLPYVTGGIVAGTTGEARRMEAIRTRLENMPGWSITYRVHMADKGWSEWVSNDAVAGTTGESRQMKAIQIRLAQN